MNTNWNKIHPVLKDRNKHIYQEISNKNISWNRDFRYNRKELCNWRGEPCKTELSLALSLPKKFPKIITYIYYKKINQHLPVRNQFTSLQEGLHPFLHAKSNSDSSDLTINIVGANVDQGIKPFFYYKSIICKGMIFALNYELSTTTRRWNNIMIRQNIYNNFGRLYTSRRVRNGYKGLS